MKINEFGRSKKKEAYIHINQWIAILFNTNKEKYISTLSNGARYCVKPIFLINQWNEILRK